MRRMIWFLSLVIYIGPGVSLRSQVQDKFSKVHVGILKIAGVSPLEALLSMGNNASLPLGIAISDPSLYTARVSRDFEGGTCDQALRLILKTAPKYAEQVSHDVLLITVPEVFQQNELLQHQFDRFSTYRPMDATDVSANLWGVLQLSLNPKRTGYGGVLRVPALDKKMLPVISEYHASLEEILDRIVLAQGHMAWVSWPPPLKLIDAPQYLLWNLVFYDQDPSASKLCCIFVPLGLQEVSDELRKRLEQ